jgi:hypothetical protein
MRRRSSPSSPIVDVIGDTTEYDRMPLPNRAAAGPEAPQKAKAEEQEDDEQDANGPVVVLQEIVDFSADWYSPARCSPDCSYIRYGAIDNL